MPSLILPGQLEAPKTTGEVLADPSEFEIDARNWAKDADARTKAREFLTDLCDQARADRAAFDQLNQQLYNIWDCTPDIRWYNGRADIYLPAGHRCIERAVAKQMARLFPTGDDCIDIAAIPEGEDNDDTVAENLEAAKALMLYNLSAPGLVRLRKQFPQFLRQLNILGTSVWATDYVTPEEMESWTSRRRVRLLRKPGLGVVGGIGSSLQEAGPRGRPVDLATWYVWPTTVDDLRDALIVFEDLLVTETMLKRWRDMGRYHFTDDQLQQAAGAVPTGSIWASSDRMKARGTEGNDRSDKLFVLTLAYAAWAPPSEMATEKRSGEEEEAGEEDDRQSSGDEDDDEADSEAVPFQFAMLGDGTVIRAAQNPWWHQESPYDAARLYPYIGEFYGRALIYFIRKMQYQINDTANQTFDASTYALNPIAAVDPLYVSDPELLQYRPAAKWPVPPKSIQWLQIPDTHREGFELVRQLWETIQESAGAATGGQYLPTLGVARGAETATGQSLLVAQSDIDIAVVTSGIEEDVLEPVCQKIDSLEQQFLPQSGERILRALGRKAVPLLRNGMRIRREQMLGTRHYLWVGSHISEQREQFQKVGPQLLAILGKLPPGPEGRVNLWRLAKNLYRSFGFADADDIIQIPTHGVGAEPQMEHWVMLAGHEIPPQLGEDYQGHMAAHDKMIPIARVMGWGDRLREHMTATMKLASTDPGFQAQQQPMPGGAGGVPQIPSQVPSQPTPTGVGPVSVVSGGNGAQG